MQDYNNESCKILVKISHLRVMWKFRIRALCENLTRILQDIKITCKFPASFLCVDMSCTCKNLASLCEKSCIRPYVKILHKGALRESYKNLARYQDNFASFLQVSCVLTWLALARFLQVYAKNLAFVLMWKFPHKDCFARILQESCKIKR